MRAFLAPSPAFAACAACARPSYRHLSACLLLPSCSISRLLIARGATVRRCSEHFRALEAIKAAAVEQRARLAPTKAPTAGAPSTRVEATVEGDESEGSDDGAIAERMQGAAAAAAAPMLLARVCAIAATAARAIAASFHLSPASFELWRRC